MSETKVQAANERVQECWGRACALAGFECAPGGSISAQVDAALKTLGGAELVAARALFDDALRWITTMGDVEEAADRLRLGAAICEQRGRVLGAIKAARAVESAISDGDKARLTDRRILVNVVLAMSASGFGLHLGAKEAK